MSPSIESILEQRLGKLHARQRLGIEAELKPRVFRNGINSFHPENWLSLQTILNAGLRMTGLYNRSRRNTLAIHVRKNTVTLPELPSLFEGYTILHMSDLHVDMYPQALHALIESIRPLKYDLCVLTGDYRAQTYGSVEKAVQAVLLYFCRLF